MTFYKLAKKALYRFNHHKASVTLCGKLYLENSYQKLTITFQYFHELSDDTNI